MSTRPLAITSWAHTGNMIARKCSFATWVTSRDFMCLDVLVDATKDSNCPEGKNAERRVGLAIFYPYGEEPPVNIDDLKTKLHDEFNLDTAQVIDLNGTLIVVGQEYVDIENYKNKIDDNGEDKLIPYSQHHTAQYSKPVTS